jgi:hypothetical protein
MAIPLAGVVANAAGDTYSVMWNLLLDVWDSPYAADIAWVAALAADEYGWPAADVFDYGLSYISEYPPHALEDLAPGSSYLDSLPAAVANSAALRVAMYPGQNGGPLALDPGITQAQADAYGGYLYAGGVILETSALYLVDHIDYNSPEYLQGIVGLTSAYDLADLLENMPIIWCDAVGGGAYSCSNNDGFIPTSNQYWSESGVTNDALAGPPHTKEPAHPAVIDWISSRLCTLTLGC